MRPEPFEAEKLMDRTSTEELALTLLAVGADQEVRVLEALAAALVNGRRHPRRNSDCALGEPAPAIFLDPATASSFGQKLQLCRRVARRALRGSLADPTLGATAFHRIEANPHWARDLLPVAVVESFLFYKLPEMNEANLSAQTRAAKLLGRAGDLQL